MQTEILPQPKANTYPSIASLWHTALLIAVQAILSYRGMLRAHQMRALVNPNRIAIYERTMLYEWLVFGLMIAGVWLHGSSVFTVLGERWRSMQQILRDLGLGVLFLMVSIMFSSVVSPHESAGENATQFLLPRGGLEMALWVAVSITAGICEEAIYRGYLQKQFMALTRSAPAGILLSAALFGAAHLYQGLWRALTISVLGAMGGILAYWCKSVRPGMIAHTLQDVLGGVIRH